MLFRILKNDLKRKKTMNIILFIFIVLATMFVASGINNVMTVMNGTDYYLDKAGVGDYVIITMGTDSVGCLDEMLETEKAVKEYRMEPVVFGSEGDITNSEGEKLKSKNTTIYQSIEDSAILFFDKNNEEIKDVEPGHIYVSGNFMQENKLESGDVLSLEHNGVKMDLTFDGMAKDAFLGSDFMGNTRIIMNDKDMEKLLADEEIYTHYRGEICYIDTDDVSAMSSAMTKASKVAFSGPRATIKMCYVMEMIVAFIMLILSVCLIIVSFVVLKFSITFTITEEFREIGVMKAIGLSNAKIRNLYIVKYFAMAVVGALIGFCASIPFGKLLLNAVSQKMVLGNDSGIMINGLGAVMVVVVIVFFAYLCTGKVKNATPTDAIRNGQTGERYKNKSVLRINKCSMNSTMFMAVNDILSSPKRFITIVLSFGICTLFVLMMVNTTATMKSPNLIHTFGTETDLYVTKVSAAMEDMNGGTREDMLATLDAMAKELTEEGMPAECCIEVQYKYPATFEGEDYVLTCQQGLNTTIEDYVFTEGQAPEGKDEIAITPQIAEMTGAKIGDVITIHYGDEDLECMVTAYIQTMNNLGELVRLHEDAPTDFSYVSSMLHYQIDFTDMPTEDEIENRKEKIKGIWDVDKVMNATEYCIDCTGVADTLESVQYLLLAITLVVVVLVTILMERSFIANEKSQIAILKAIGFTDKAVIKWHVYRIGIVALISVILASVLSIPMTKLCITPIFGMMGATEINYNIEPLQVFVLYPGIVFLVTILMTRLTAQYTKTIQSSDTANIE